MKKQYLYLILPNLIFFVLHNILWRIIIDDSSLAMAAFAIPIIVAWFLYRFFYGIFSYKITQKIVVPQLILFFSTLIAWVDIAIYDGGNIQSINVLGFLLLLLLFMIVPIISALITKVVIKVRNKKKKVQ